jgi:hypothetical protein
LSRLAFGHTQSPPSRCDSGAIRCAKSRNSSVVIVEILQRLLKEWEAKPAIPLHLERRNVSATRTHRTHSSHCTEGPVPQILLRT